jgi:hypothetical protein
MTEGLERFVRCTEGMERSAVISFVELFGLLLVGRGFSVDRDVIEAAYVCS